MIEASVYVTSKFNVDVVKATLVTCKMVMVAGHVYYFLCERWFAVEEDDGKVEREVMALDGDIGFSTVSYTSVHICKFLSS